MGSTRTGRFDRVIPTVGLVQVGQGPAEAVVHALARIGDEGDTLPKQGRFRELACLRTPTAHVLGYDARVREAIYFRQSQDRTGEQLGIDR
jgi:hypothetical protein